MKKLVKMMVAVLILVGIVEFMGCKQATDGGVRQDIKTKSDVTKPGEKVGPKIVKKDTINGKEYDIVEFGIWPQSKYSGDEDKLKLCEKGINAWEQNICYTDGTDNYIKVIAEPNGGSSTFDDGSSVESKVYYFKFEPIQWRVLTDKYKGKKLLFAEKALVASCFYPVYNVDRTVNDKTVYPNNYEYSEVRAYLNGLDGSSYSVKNFKNEGFLQKAFTPAEIAIIPETDIDNSWQSTFGTGEEVKTYYKDHIYDCANTKDKIFLLSEKEITTAEYGFDDYSKSIEDSNNDTTLARIRKTTDYVRATEVWSGSEEYQNNSVFWLRSPYYNNRERSHVVGVVGSAIFNDPVSSSFQVVVPALAMTF